jgi:YfiR/HmsC-like
MFAVFGSLGAHAAEFTADSVKAAFLYRFASYVEWPDDAPAIGPFVIAVSGADEVASQLERLLRHKTMSGRPVVMRRVSSAQELDGAHILYVGAQAFARTRSLREAALTRPILMVTDNEHGLDGGGVINFTEVDRNVRFEISLVAADRARLKIDSALLSVAAHVERRPQAAISCRMSACAITVAAVEAGGIR